MRYLAILLSALLVGAGGLTACSSQPTVTGTSRAPTPLNLGSDVSAVVATIQPDDGVQTVVNYINSATKTLDIAVYQMEPDYDVLVEALQGAQDRGVKVRILLSSTIYPPTAENGNPADAERLRDLGFDVELSRPEFSFSHWKVLIADGATEKGSVLLCDFNLGPGYFGLDPAYPDQGETRGMAVLDTDPVDVSMIQRTFDADWPPYEPWPANDTAHLVWSPSDPTCDSPSCQMPGAPLEPVGNSRAAISALLGSATTSLDVYVQAFAYPSELLQALVNACASGVKVRVVGNEGGINDEVLRSLGKCGAQVRWNTTDPSGDGRVMYIHTKTIVADAGLPTGVAYVGSVNPFLDESVQTERELGILITDPASVDRIDAVFNRDFEAGTSAL